MSEAVVQAGTRKKKRRTARRVVLILAVLLVLGLAGFITLRNLQAEYTVTYDGYTASRGTISNSLSFTGSMQLVNSKTYAASSAAKVREVYVAAGDRVKEGDKLLRLSNGETLKADFDGTVNKLDAAAGDEVTPEDTLVQLADFDHMRVTFRIGEGSIGDVAVNQPCRVTVPSAGAAFEAAVTAIDYASYSGNNVAYYTATVDVDTAEVAQIYPGMQATITLPQEEAENVVVLRMDAVSTAPDNTAFVYKQAGDGTMVETPVTVGVSNGNYVEIRAGVSEGETVFAVAKKQQGATGLQGMFSSMFGSQQVNMPANNWTRNNNSQTFNRNPGNSGNPGNRGN